MSAYKLRQIIQQAKRRQLVRQPIYIQNIKKIGLICGFSLCVLLTAILIFSAYFYQQITIDLPPISNLEKGFNLQNGLFLQPTQIYDRSGTHVLYSLALSGTKRKFLPVDTNQPDHLSPEYIKAVIATYEPDYWQDTGIDWSNLFNPKPTTINERLVNDVLLPYDQADFSHTIRMKLLASTLSQKYDKKRILEWFINSQYFGHFTFGPENAAQLYFGKSAANLTLGESAFLLAIVESPALNPIDSPASALEGRKNIITTWEKNQAIQPATADFLIKENITLANSSQPIDKGRTAFINLVIHQAESTYPAIPLERGGMKIISTLDWDIQNQITCTLRHQLVNLKNKDQQSVDSGVNSCVASELLPLLPSNLTYPDNLSASAISLDLQKGEILGLVGDANLNEENSHLSMHNPGTLLTPFVSLTAFERGYSPSSLVWDIPAKLPANLPSNFSENSKFLGAMRLRTALANDYLTPQFNLLDQLGPANVWKLTEPMGLHLSGSSADPVTYLLSGSKTSLFYIARAYSTIANQGYLIGQSGDDHTISPNMILQIQDGFGSSLVNFSQAKKQLIINPPTAYLVNDILSDDQARQATYGSSTWFDIGKTSAVKVGQTEDKKDVWTVGYTPQRLIAVWVGAPESNSTSQLDYRASTGIWNALMRYVSQSIPDADWPTPNTIHSLDVCDPSGDLPTPYCPNVVKEIFISGNEPSTPDSLYHQYFIDRETGKLATIFTSLGLVDQKVFMVPPADILPWFKSSGLPIPPDEYDNIQMPPTQPDISINDPVMFAKIHGEIMINGSASGSLFTNYHLDVGKGLNPDSWQQIGQPGSKPVINGSLGTWKTTDFENGLYILRLTVENNDHSIKTAIIQVMVDNPNP